MGWANCGEDSKGRPIGYAHTGTCDHPGGCTEEIYRGINYACGGMHGADENSCEGYFCGVHRRVVVKDGVTLHLCLACAANIPDAASDGQPS